MAARGYQVTRSIAAPPQTVWSLLTDAGSYSEWNRAVLSIKGPIELDRTIELVSIVDPKRTFTLKVTEMSAPNRMVWSDGMPLGLFTGRRTYSIVDDGAGGSEFTMVEEFTGPLAGLITRAIPDLTESFDLFADGVKAAAETPTGP